jgi:hypothetical protein
MRDASTLRVDRRTWLILIGLSVWYIVLMWFPAHRELWYDELLTYYLARMPTLRQLLETAHQVDLSPPLEFLLVRLSTFAFGGSEAAVRLPSMVAFYAGSICLFFYMSRKAGAAFACFGLALLWCSDTFFLGAKARPYALVFGLFSLLLLSWDRAVTAERRTAVLWGVAVANLAMLAAHVFAPLSLLPFLAAEAVRFHRRRKPDYALWAALLLPLAVMALYIPLIHTYSGSLYPPAFQASIPKIAKFYLHTLKEAGIGLAAILAVALIRIAVFRKAPGGTPTDHARAAIRPADYALFAFLLLSPAIANLVLLRSHGAFWPRYCITTSAGIFGGIAIFLAIRVRLPQAAAYAAVLVLVLVSVVRNTVLPAVHSRVPEDSLEQIAPGLPLVAASGLTFIELDHYGSGALAARLYYLKDRSAAVRYVHATLFEDFESMDKLKRFFPIRANVEPYSLFMSEHHQFLVLGTPDYPEDWLLEKLHDDGAGIQMVRRLNLPNKDKNLYLVTMP